MMKIPLSDPHISVKSNSLRQVSNVTTSYYLMAMVQASDQIEYRKYATMLRKHIMPKQENQYTYLCAHPEWFEESKQNYNSGKYENKEMVDSTTCSLCGFSNYCTLGIDQREHVTIHSLDRTLMPARDQILPLFTFENVGFEHIPTDPFVGFSRHAGSTRKLYIVKLESLMKRFPADKKYSSTLEYAIGYDRQSGRVLWPLEQIFLELYEKQKKSSMINVNDISLKDGYEMTIMDRQFILSASSTIGWLKTKDTKRKKNELLSFFAALIYLLKTDNRFSQLRNKGNSSMTPGVEHGFSSSGSGFAVIAFIWMSSRIDDFNILIGNYSKGENLDFLIERLVQSEFQENPHLPKYLPRYPALALIPKNWNATFNLESPIFRVINGVEYDGDCVLLIIDPLNSDLEGVFNNG